MSTNDETLNEDAGAALVALTTILVGLPIGTAAAKAITAVINTVAELRNEKKLSEAKQVAERGLAKYKHLAKKDEGLSEESNCTGAAIAADEPFGGKKKKKDEETAEDMKEEITRSVREAMTPYLEGYRTTLHKVS